MKPEVRALLPSHSKLFTKKLAIQVQAPKPENKREIFELAAHPENFYSLMNMLNVSASVGHIGWSGSSWSLPPLFSPPLPSFPFPSPPLLPPRVTRPLM